MSFRQILRYKQHDVLVSAARRAIFVNFELQALESRLYKVRANPKSFSKRSFQAVTLSYTFKKILFPFSPG